MNIYIALLRGINVGGHHKIKMAELKKLLLSLRLQNVQTYIQSGNICFQSKTNDKYKLEQTIKALIYKHYGFEIPVIVKTVLEFQHIFDQCPFSELKKETSYFVILNKIPTYKNIQLAFQKNYPDDEYQISNDCIYLFCKKGYGQSKFNLKYFEKTLEVTATVRNFKTMNKLLTLASKLIK